MNNISKIPNEFFYLLWFSLIVGITVFYGKYVLDQNLHSQDFLGFATPEEMFKWVLGRLCILLLAVYAVYKKPKLVMHKK